MLHAQLVCPPGIYNLNTFLKELKYEALPHFEILSCLPLLCTVFLPPITLYCIKFKCSNQEPVLSTFNICSTLTRVELWKYAEISQSLKKDILKCMCGCKTIHFPFMTERSKVLVAPLSCILLQQFSVPTWSQLHKLVWVSLE
jgi:hypothetical protein